VFSQSGSRFLMPIALRPRRFAATSVMPVACERIEDGVAGIGEVGEDRERERLGRARPMLAIRISAVPR
jgi:hypothetical protein